MLRRLLARPRRSVAIASGVLFLAANVLAFLHAWRFTHFVEGAERTGRPEELSFWTKASVLFTGVDVPRPVNRAEPAQPFDTVRFPTTDGLTLEAWHVPADEPRGTVLLFHGYTGVKADMLAQAEVFVALGYDALLVDFRGSGGSDGGATTVGYREADDVAAAVAFARGELGAGPLFLYGQSMGAAAALRAVGVNGLEVDGLVLVCPFDRFATTIANRFELMGAPPSPGTELLMFWGSVQQGFWTFDHDPVDYAAGVTCPTLHLQGGGDQRVTMDEARSIFDALAGPKELVEFTDVGHLVSCLEADPALWRERVGAFLERHR